MKTDIFKITPIVSLVLKQNDKILLVHRSNTGHLDGTHSLVGGHVDGNETMRQALVREAHEEIGITIKPEDLRFVQVIHHTTQDKRELVQFFFTTDAWQGEPYNKEPHKHDNVEWFAINALPSSLLPHVRKLLEHYPHHNPYAEFGWSAQSLAL